MKRTLLTSFRSLSNFFIAAKRAWMVEYRIEILQYMSSVMVSLEKWMIVLEKLETEEMKALAMVQ